MRQVIAKHPCVSDEGAFDGIPMIDIFETEQRPNQNAVSRSNSVQSSQTARFTGDVIMRYSRASLLEISLQIQALAKLTSRRRVEG